MPFYLISLIEHKSDVDYNVVMQVFRYIVFIWKDYEKEMEKQQPEISKTKSFRYPPILPIVFYDGRENWTAAIRLHERVLFSDMLGEYIPDYRCILMQLKEYSNAELMKREDVLSVVMMLTNLHQASDFMKVESEVSPEYLQKVLKDAPEYLLNIVIQVMRALLGKINVPDEEIEKFSEQIKEQHMGKLFANFEPYDVQATRREAREEGIKEGIEQGIEQGRAEGLIMAVKQLGGTMETAIQQLINLYGLNETEAQEKVKQYW